jgi:energy-coupling factor transporter transmembrane protein EcfT
MLWPAPGVPALAMVLAVLLQRTGLGPAAQLRSLWPWRWLILVMILIHTFTTTAAAPLGHPSWGGMAAGAEALLRLAVSVGWLALLNRLKSLDEMVLGARWWLRPLEAVGLPTGQAALVLAVALGTIPRVMGEGRRVAAVQAMRRSLPGGRVSRRRRFEDRIAVVTPLLEGLMRRADTLSLSLRTRRPATGPVREGPGLVSLLGLILLLSLLLLGRRYLP